MLFFPSKFGVALALLLVASETSAELKTGVGDDPALGRGFTAYLSGEITAQDADELAGIKNLADTANVRMLFLNSSGGDVESSFRIGRIVRKLGLRTIVPPGADCFSACVFILAAGIDRVVKGRVGIHRPYFPAPPGQNISAALHKIEQESRDYLVEMNIPTRLADDMFSVDPREMELLDERQLQDYRLTGRDMVDREESALRNAADLGMTRQEYEAFAGDLNYRCTVFSGQRAALFDCIRLVATEHGIPPEKLTVFGGER